MTPLFDQLTRFAFLGIVVLFLPISALGADPYAARYAARAEGHVERIYNVTLNPQFSKPSDSFDQNQFTCPKNGQRLELLDGYVGRVESVSKNVQKYPGAVAVRRVTEIDRRHLSVAFVKQRLCIKLRALGHSPIKTAFVFEKAHTFRSPPVFGTEYVRFEREIIGFETQDGAIVTEGSAEQLSLLATLLTRQPTSTPPSEHDLGDSRGFIERGTPVSEEPIFSSKVDGGVDSAPSAGDAQ